jgi:hypothetical protein
MKCVACLQGDFHECRLKGNCEDNDDVSFFPDGDIRIPSPLGSIGTVDDSRDSSNSEDHNQESEDAQAFRTYKDDSALKDQQSTGRKRAAKMYPLDTEADCEWQMKKNCGGGKLPIIGCLNGKQEARHHGPDKNTLNNEKGNVHRICHFCHNRWHTLNDPDYVWGAIYDPHNPRMASPVDVALNEEFWNGKTLVKAKD